ncbi:MAG: TonB-dependent receptor plug domain-containing protein [Bacteroidales bacterium]|nr:TonB-dependent receptor plug domain-containing protein [Bacteroidales bacterium]
MKRSIIILIVTVFSVSIMAQEKDSITVGNPVIPVITLTDTELDGDNQSQDISGLLQSSQDIFTNTAGYTFGQARFRIRGYDNQNTTVLMNGIYVNDAETGRAYYSNWGGLNDATRNKVNSSGLAFSDYAFGGLGGVTNIITRASEYRPGSSISYSVANKNYRNRVMVTHATGMMESGWAFTFSASSRWAQQGYIPGTFYEAYAYFLAAEKKINDKHSINLTVFGAPTRSGRSGVATLEAYELSGDHFYNPNWGYQNGVMRNARVGTYHQPRGILSHYWQFDESMKLVTSMSYMFGRGGTTALNWYDAADPRPDYYRKFPSYYEEGEYMFDYLTDMWENDEASRQLDWDAFYDANRKNLYTVVDESGIDGNNITGNRAKFMIEERRNDLNRFDFSSIFSKELNENSKFVGGVTYMSSKTHNFKIVSDLLGSDWWLDIDQFAERDFDDEYIIQNDLENPDRVVYEDEIFGYDYISNINKADVFGQVEYKLAKLDFFGAVDLSYTEFWRTGNMQNGKFPLNSKGDSFKKQFYNYDAKTGLVYKITGRNFVLLNLAYMTRAPYFRDAYISPRTRDHVVDNLVSEQIMSGDLSYHYRASKFQAKITGYYTEFNNGIENNSFYHDELRTFVNYIMTDVDKVHYGGEFGLEAKLTSTITMTAATGYGKYLYNSRPNVTIAQDNSSEVLAENRTVYIQNYHLGGMPEFAASVGGKYNAPKYWFVGVNANYFGESYVTLNPERRTVEALDIYVTDDPQIDFILEQQKLDPGYTFDIWGGKSWRLKRKYNVGFTLSVNNILNNTNLITNGFEQFRFDKTDIDKFPNKYYYMYGRSYFLNVYFRF